MSLVSFALAVIFIIRLFSTSAFRVPKMIAFNMMFLDMFQNLLCNFDQLSVASMAGSTTMIKGLNKQTRCIPVS